MKINQSITGLSILSISINILFGIDVSYIIETFISYNIQHISITSWINLSLIIVFWVVVNVATFIKLKYKLKKSSQFKPLFYIMLLPLMIITCGVLSLILSIKYQNKE